MTSLVSLQFTFGDHLELEWYVCSFRVQLGQKGIKRYWSSGSHSVVEPVMPPLDIVRRCWYGGRHKHRPVLDIEDVVVDLCTIYIVKDVLDGLVVLVGGFLFKAVEGVWYMLWREERQCHHMTQVCVDGVFLVVCSLSKEQIFIISCFDCISKTYSLQVSYSNFLIRSKPQQFFNCQVTATCFAVSVSSLCGFSNLVR